MRQVLFWIPIETEWFPDGIPIHGYGVMLFVTFFVCMWLGVRWASYAQMPKEKIQDLAILVFVLGLVGARVVYMIQYKRPVAEFFKIWEGGIVFYGSLFGGVAAYILFHRYVLRKMSVPFWRPADVVAPIVCVGLALGRVGCFLNGCCYGHVAGPDCVAAEFPLLTSPARDLLVKEAGLQTSVGFAAAPRERESDPRTVVSVVEPGSAAAEAGVRPGDRVVGVNGGPNRIFLEVPDGEPVLGALARQLQAQGHAVEAVPPAAGADGYIRAAFADPEAYRGALQLVRDAGAPWHAYDSLSELVFEGPKGRTELSLEVRREDGEVVALPAFTPRTLGLYPTQLYETASMVLLFFVLLAFYPLRRHDGQVFVLFLAGYALHRFVNEQLRNDTDAVWFGVLTLSQGISLLILLAAVGLEIYLRATQPKLTGAAPAPPAAS
ncbi:MAG TPA: prolipoprotein diacylglyceryl transferase family protein [Gemmataceae bacterium]